MKEKPESRDQSTNLQVDLAGVLLLSLLNLLLPRLKFHGLSNDNKVESVHL